MTRLGSVCAAFAGVLVLASAARADEGTLPNNAQIKFERFYIHDGTDFVEPPTDDDARQYLNLAHCTCSKTSPMNPRARIQYELTLSADTDRNRPGEVWLGAGCFDDVMRPMNCVQVTDQTIGDIDVLTTMPARIELALFDVIFPKTKPDTCTQQEGTANIWILVDEDGNGTYEYGKSNSLGTTATNTNVAKYDTQPPPLPSNFRAQAGEASIEITWDAPTDRPGDLYAFQALCMDANGAPLTGIDRPAARYQTTRDVCDLPQDFPLTPSTVASTTGTELAALPAPFASLDPAYLCADQPQATAPGLTIEGLENGEAYAVALIAVDQYGNPVGTYFTRTLVPEPVTDFWEDLQDRNSGVEGGCLLATTYGDGNPLTSTLRSFRDRTLAQTSFGRALTRAYYATIGKLGPAVDGSLALRVLAAVVLAPLVVLALLWHVLTLPGLLLVLALPWLWRRRHRLGALRWVRRLAPAAVALAVLAPAAAHADDFVPYWEDDGAGDDLGADYGDVKWHAGIRVGMYVPEIDLQAGLNAVTGKGPYEAMFGDYYTENASGELVKHERNVWQILPMLDVDYIVWNGFGQVGVGGSLGYMQKSAYAYANGTSEDDEMRVRSTASRNTFRLIPMAATVTYRFTLFDELWGVPVVPYVRGGLSYYAWWITAPNGNYARYCEGDDTTMCDENKARGGSLGFQGSIGLAVRAERIDADAARSMRSSGIMHAGFYGEFQYAKVDGFGDDTKLSVGDNTWFAGVNFEF